MEETNIVKTILIILLDVSLLLLSIIVAIRVLKKENKEVKSK